MNALREGRNSVGISMVLFFIAGIFGIITHTDITVYGGFFLSVISAVFVISLTLIIDRNEKRIIK